MTTASRCSSSVGTLPAGVTQGANASAVVSIVDYSARTVDFSVGSIGDNAYSVLGGAYGIAVFEAGGDHLCGSHRTTTRTACRYISLAAPASPTAAGSVTDDGRP